jgi:transposase
MSRLSCPVCGAQKSYRIRRQKRLCSSCRHEWNPAALPLRLTKKQWKQILKWFVLGHSIEMISKQTGMGRERIIRALLIVREVMKSDMPEQFSGIVEVDETYMGGRWVNKRKRIRARGTKRGRGTNKQPVFGIYARDGTVWAELVDDTKAKTLQPLITGQVRSGSTICSDTWKGYTGIATKGYVHRLVDHGKEFANGKVHINGLEGFWGYLKRQLAAKGGIRRERLALYLGEYVWRYNHRKLTIDERVSRLMKLLNKRRLFGG